MIGKISRQEITLLFGMLSGILFSFFFINHAFAQNELHIVTVTASSSSSTSVGPQKVIDNNLSTYWQGRSGLSWWMQLDLGQGYSLAQISLWWDTVYGVTKYNIQASADADTWTNFYTGLSSSGGAANPYQQNFNLSGKYRYVRICINSARKSYPRINEIKLFGDALDAVPPTGSIKINNDAAYTNSTEGVLALSAQDNIDESGVTEMQFSNDNATWSSPEVYAAAKSWTMASGDGTKTVYVKFKDNAGNWSSVYSDSIILDTTPPQITTVTPQPNATFYEKDTITLSGQVNDTDSSPLEYQYSLDNVIQQAWSGQASYTYNNAGAGKHLLRIEVRDAGGQDAEEIEVYVFRKPVPAP